MYPIVQRCTPPKYRQPLEGRNLDAMKNRFKAATATAARNAFASGRPSDSTTAVSAPTAADDDGLDEFDRQMLEMSEQADTAESVRLLEDDSQATTPTQSSTKSKSKTTTAPAAKKARTEAATSKQPSVIESEDLALLRDVVSNLANKTGKDPREVLYTIFRHSGFVDRAELSLTQADAPSGCDPADDHLFDDYVSDDETSVPHDAHYPESLSAERYAFLNGIPG